MLIPDIAFTPARSRSELIEVMDLDSLYRRRSQLDHDPQTPHRIGFHLLISITAGSGRHLVDFVRHEFAAGSYIFLQRRQIHAFDLSGRPQGKAILYTDDFISRLQASMRSPILSPTHLVLPSLPVFRPEAPLHESGAALLSEIDKEASRPDGDSLIIMSLFSALFLLLNRARPSEPGSFLSRHQMTLFKRFADLLESDFTQSKNAIDYAAKLNLTYKSLNQLCKRATGLTAKRLIDRFTILEAKRRLVLEQQSIQRLSDELGFDEMTNFVKFFRKRTGLTPARFRRIAQD